MTDNSFKTFLIALLSLTLLFAVSCSNEGTTGGVGNSDLGDAVYVGSVNRTALTGDTAMAPEETTIGDLSLTIANNKLTIGNGIGTFVDVQIVKSGSEYSANNEFIDTDGSLTIKQGIKFTVSPDGNTIEVLEYKSTYSTETQILFTAIYKGTLTKII